MKNKCDSETTEGSNDDYFHLIQVKWVKIVIIFFAYIYVTPNSSKSDTFSHDFILNLFYKHSNRSLFFQIYTDWANYYLERSNSKRKVSDLSVDARDGLLLAQIVEAVTNFKVPDLIKKPKSQQQAVSVTTYTINQPEFCRWCQVNVSQ